MVVQHRAMVQRSHDKTLRSYLDWWVAIVSHSRRHRLMMCRMSLRRWVGFVQERSRQEESWRRAVRWRQVKLSRKGLKAWRRSMSNAHHERQRQHCLIGRGQSFHVSVGWFRFQVGLLTLRTEERNLRGAERWRAGLQRRRGLQQFRWNAGDAVRRRQRLVIAQDMYRRTILAPRLRAYLRQWQRWSRCLRRCELAAKVVETKHHRAVIKALMVIWRAGLDREIADKARDTKASNGYQNRLARHGFEMLRDHALDKRYCHQAVQLAVTHRRRICLRRWVMRTAQQRARTERARMNLERAGRLLQRRKLREVGI